MTLFFFFTGCTHYGLEKWKPEEHLELSRHYMNKGEFDASLQESRTAYDLYPRSLGDQALFQMGLIFSHPDNPKRNYQNAQNAFQTIIKKYPFSRFKGEAELWLKILALEMSLNQKLMLQNKEQQLTENQLREMERKWKTQKNSVKQVKARYDKVIQSKNRQIKTRDLKIQELQRSIDQLKEIDLKIEEKKRKTTP